MSVPFRFSAETHVYTDLSGKQIPNISMLLELGGLVDSDWFTEESCERGTEVHRLAEDYDMGTLTDPEACVSRYRGYLLGHVAAMKVVPHDWALVEEAFVHPVLRFAGKPDRAGRVFGLGSVWEIKSGVHTRAHGVQTALQALLVADRLKLPADMLARFGCYLTERGRFKIEQFKDAKDFAVARSLIQRFA